MKIAPSLTGVPFLVSIRWWHLFSNGAIAWTTNIPSGQHEFRVNVSEWVLNSTSASYLLNDRDYDSHTPLLIEVHANLFSRSRTKEMKETKVEQGPWFS